MKKSDDWKKYKLKLNNDLIDKDGKINPTTSSPTSTITSSSTSTTTSSPTSTTTSSSTSTIEVEKKTISATLSISGDEKNVVFKREPYFLSEKELLNKPAGSFYKKENLVLVPIKNSSAFASCQNLSPQGTYTIADVTDENLHLAVSAAAGVFGYYEIAIKQKGNCETILFPSGYIGCKRSSSGPVLYALCSKKEIFSMLKQ